MCEDGGEEGILDVLNSDRGLWFGYALTLQYSAII